MKTVYPVIFTQKNDEKNTVLVEVPDIHQTTQGFGLFDAFAMARDLIELYCITMEDGGDEIEPPSDINCININKAEFKDVGDSFAALVDIDTDAYRKKYDNRSVRRNVTLPAWLNKEAEKAKINVSKVLQKALMETLGV